MPINNNESKWTLEHNGHNKKINANNVHNKTSIKRKLEQTKQCPDRPIKRQKAECSSTKESKQQWPQGLSWHENSCAYDATLTIIHAIWKEDPTKWSNILTTMNENLLTQLVQNFILHQTGTLHLTAARDRLRHHLSSMDPDNFGWGELTSIQQLIGSLLTTSATTVEASLECTHTCPPTNNRQPTSSCCMISIVMTQPTSIGKWIADWKERTQHQCATCKNPMIMKFNLCYPPPLIAFDFAWQNPDIDTQLEISIRESNFLYRLRGIIYFGDNHFTARIVSNEGTTWFHDGMETREHVIYEGPITTLQTLTTCKGKTASAAIYTKQD